MTPIRTRSISATILIKCLFGILASLLVLAYIIFQARLFIAGPQIVLVDEPSTIQNERSVVLRGVAENITEITINGRPISTNAEGVFEEPVVLENGYTIVSISAHDRYGRETMLQRDFVYVPEETFMN